MSEKLNVALTLSLNDRLVGPLQRTLSSADRQLGRLSSNLGEVTRAGGGAAQGLDRVARSASSLGQASRGVLSLTSATREAERGARGLAAVWEGLSNTVGRVGRLAAGLTVGMHSIAAPVRRSLDYDQELRLVANTAYNGKSLDEKRAGMRDIDATVMNSVRQGGGTRESALAAYGNLIAGGVPRDQAKRLLPSLTMSSTAHGMDTLAASNLALSGLNNGFKPHQIAEVIDRAAAAGKEGAFELRDMVPWLPKFFAEGRNSGLVGMTGLQRMLAVAEASVTAAGSKEQAGSNALNLLSKLNANDTSSDLKKLGYGDAASYLLSQREAGFDSVEAYANMLRREAEKDPRWRSLRAEGAGLAPGSARSENIAAQERILSGGIMSKVFQDREARMAMIAYMNQPELVARVMSSGARARGVTEKDFELMSDSGSFRLNRLGQNSKAGQQKVVDFMSSNLGGPIDAFNDWMEQPGDRSTLFGGLLLGGTALGAGGLTVGGLRMLSRSPQGAAASSLARRLLMSPAARAGAAAAGSTAALPVASLVAAGGAGLQIGDNLYESHLAGTRAGNSIGYLTAQLMAALGSNEAKDAIAADKLSVAADQLIEAARVQKEAGREPVRVTIDSNAVYTAVETRAQRELRRR